MPNGVTWDDEDLRRRIERTPERLDAVMAAIISRGAPRAERYMKSNASWTDRTGNARQGLHAVPERQKLEFYMVVLAHTVSYGIWLEIANSAKYAIIEPSLVRQGNLIMRDMSRLFERAFG